MPNLIKLKLIETNQNVVNYGRAESYIPSNFNTSTFPWSIITTTVLQVYK